MKKRIHVIVFAIITIMTIGAIAEGVLPSLTDEYGVEMPSMARSVDRCADEEVTNESGALIQTFYYITEEQFTAFLDYLEKQKCIVKDYSVEGRTVIVEMEKEGSSFTMCYDTSDGTTAITYPSGTIVEAYVPYPVGSIVTMGNYGGEAVEWLVLAAEGENRTMIAVKGQDAVSFANVMGDIYKWESSYIRTWLNDTYYNTAFSTEEQAMIVAGPTGDKVWLLSEEEAKQYFKTNRARVCYPTEYAKNHGTKTYKSGAGCWWLRSPGISVTGVVYVHCAAIADEEGDVTAHRRSLDEKNIMARPVVVVSLGLSN